MLFAADDDGVDADDACHFFTDDAAGATAAVASSIVDTIDGCLCCATAAAFQPDQGAFLSPFNTVFEHLCHDADACILVSFGHRFEWTALARCRLGTTTTTLWRVPVPMLATHISSGV